MKREARPPLVVDLDGTLTPTNTLLESLIAILRRRPLALFRVLGWLMKGRAVFKDRVAREATPSVKLLPWRHEFVDWLREQRNSGRTLILATAAHQRIAHDVAAELQLFDAVLATNTEVGNLKGPAKLTAIRSAIGERFSYAGDSEADLPIWDAAETAVVVGAAPSLAADVRRRTTVEREFPPNAPAGAWLPALRLHQWVKNTLVFVPLLTSYSFVEIERVLQSLLAFAALSLVASATYLLNDLWDLENDRQHERKRSRPIASAQLAVHNVLLVSVCLLLIAAGIGSLISASFLVALLGYVVLTTAYSLNLKQLVLVDVVALALLHTYRVFAGAVALDVRLTPWLLAFSVFIFLSLALVKRCAELVAASSIDRTKLPGRDYQVTDLAVLMPLGVGAGLCSVVVFGLYLGSPQARALYGEAEVLWLVGIVLIYWISHMWLQTCRGNMHDDPIVFAIRDRASQLAIGLMILLPVATHFVQRVTGSD